MPKNLRRATITIPEDLYVDAMRMAGAEHRSFSNLVTVLIDRCRRQAERNVVLKEPEPSIENKPLKSNL